MSLLINEPPLQVLPSLAIQIGLNEAIVLQQLHYLLPMAQTTHDGKKWVYNSFEDWQAQHFPFFSVDTVKRTFNNLRQSGLILCEKLQKQQRNQTNFYTINYEKLDELCANNGHSQAENSVKNTQKAKGKMPQSISANCTNGQGQNAPMSLGQNAPMLQENTNRIHTRECIEQNSSEQSALVTDEKTDTHTLMILDEKLNIKQIQDLMCMAVGEVKAKAIIERPEFQFWLLGFNTHYETQPLMTHAKKYYRLSQWLISEYNKVNPQPPVEQPQAIEPQTDLVINQPQRRYDIHQLGDF